MALSNLHSYARFKDAKNRKNNKGVRRTPQVGFYLTKPSAITFGQALHLALWPVLPII
jgi:hypothetical protein